ncbi:hypothetical protein [Herpetosiphon gulosus]|uniref:Uncharacterized protein n=1 Tax=Herpetosiphon gulosus TaxID=1973496 RepID=A0ABP9X7C4_9CHLR
MDTTETEEHRTWWVIFPVRGLTLANRTHDLDKPLFGDATFLSAQHLRTVGRKNALFAMHDIITLLPNKPMRGDTYLAVCRRASLAVIDDDAVYDALIMQAKERAEQLIAALAVMIFAQRADGTTIGLLEQSYSRFQFLSIFGREHGGWVHSMNGMDAARTIPGHEQIVWTRRELRQWLRNPWWYGLVASAINPVNAIPRSFRNALTQASIRLAEAFNSPTRSTQLIGAVTALEVLLSYTNQGTGFSTIEQRIDALLGSSWATRLRVKDVFHARP